MDPALPAPEARVVWNAADAPAAVVFAAPVPPDIPVEEILAPAHVAWFQPFDQGHIVRVQNGPLLVSTGDLPYGAPFGILLLVDRHWEARCAAAARLRAAILGHGPPAGPLTAQQRHRLRDALRVRDACNLGASYRTIAQQFHGTRRVASEHWLTSSLKARIARLAKHGRHLSVTGYRELLLGRSPMS